MNTHILSQSTRRQGVPIRSGARSLPVSVLAHVSVVSASASAAAALMGAGVPLDLLLTVV